MSAVTLRKALGVLAKSSPFSVKTTSDRPRDVYDDLKEYLYVKPDIELDFEHVLSSLRPGIASFSVAVVVMVNLKFSPVAMSVISSTIASIWMQPIAFRLINQQSMR